MAGLDRPRHDDELYLARGDEVLASRPLMTGDVLEPVRVPGLPAGAHQVMVITHPCSMRSDGVTLAPSLLVAVMEVGDPQPLLNPQGRGCCWQE